MNYLKTYCNLIRKAEKRGYTKKKAKEQGLYVEGHHTFPISIFGKNKRIVYLTAREHYITHALLERICIQRYGKEHWKSKKMMYAFWCLNNENSKNTYLNSYLYENSKLNFSIVHRETLTGRKHSEESKRKRSEKLKGENNPMYKKTHTDEVKEYLRSLSVGENNGFYGCKHNEETRKRMQDKQRKYVYIFISPDGIVTETMDVKGFSNENGLTHSKVNATSRGLHSHHKGWKISRRPRNKDDK